MISDNSANEARLVMIVGASDKPDRYAYKAMKLLLAHGFRLRLVHPRLQEIEGLSVISDLSQVRDDAIDTVTLYVNPTIGETLTDALVHLRPRRVIFNPGSECPVLARKLSEAGIATLEACTLVLLQTDQF